MTRPPRIFINGFGRIGRTVLRQALSAGIPVAGINDIAPLDRCAYLMRYDSVYGPYPAPVQAEDGGLRIGGQTLAFHHTPDLRTLDLRGVDVVLDCTGKATDRSFARAGLMAGAANVLISGPSAAAERTVVLGANDQDLGAARIVSNASCTTNAIAPLLRAIDMRLGVATAHVTTIHCYTGSQPTVDHPGPSPERSRAAAVSMVPTSTSAADQVIRVLPGFRGRLGVAAVRVPCLSVSAIDATLHLSADLTGPLAEVLQAVLAGNPLIGLTDDPCVSTDFRARPESLVLALPQAQVVGRRQLRLFGWYDNEWGFSARMLDMAHCLAARRDPHGRCSPAPPARQPA